MGRLESESLKKFIAEHSKILETDNLNDIIDRLDNGTFYIDPSQIASDGLYSFISEIKDILAEREILKDNRTIKYMKIGLSFEMTLTLWNEEICYYRSMIKVGKKIKFVNCRVNFTRYGVEVSLGDRGFIVD
ncbi:TVG0642496 [Thermoplasma volcanium GSS1]|uniref:TVG0642496 protein n=1 Tax=Thermoplasma volcanium (strain ATCC 51530 / DSM 4299 / JCM 9571 / NBRC 15438 / GSS1) TaxID=273116 RepID=Q97B12_THEVO|nr:hypothetical protein [Thermoplasma volcanium]BAB59789.1 TVG0642496 [Thermoplasma volcanium GSS1]